MRPWSGIRSRTYQRWPVHWLDDEVQVDVGVRRLGDVYRRVVTGDVAFTEVPPEFTAAVTEGSQLSLLSLSLLNLSLLTSMPHHSFRYFGYPVPILERGNRTVTTWPRAHY